MIHEIGEYEGEDIRKQVDRLLRDVGNPEPPISLDDVRALLNLDRKYYNTADPGLLDEVAHKVRVGGSQIVQAASRLFDIAKKAKLVAFWLPESQRILIDSDAPEKKHRWIEAHEIGHSITPWHKTFLFGDSEHTLDPACHAAVEGEANYAAGQLLFLRERFGREARDLELSFKTVQALSKRYGNSLTSTLWRIIEERDPNSPVFGIVSAHPRYPSIGRTEDGRSIRHFIRSRGFRERFPSMTPEDAYGILKLHAGWTKRGTLFKGDHPLIDSNGCLCEFHVDCLATQYYALTYGVFLREIPTLVAAGFHG